MLLRVVLMSTGSWIILRHRPVREGPSAKRLPGPRKVNWRSWLRPNLTCVGTMGRKYPSVDQNRHKRPCGDSLRMGKLPLQACKTAMMPCPDGFVTTRWSQVTAAGTGRRETLAWLCSAYWEALQAHVRRRGYSASDTDDLTQDFLVQVLQGGLIERADKQRGRFRPFLLACLDHHLSHARERAAIRPDTSYRRSERCRRHSHEAATLFVSRIQFDDMSDLKYHILIGRTFTGANKAKQILRDVASAT